jgi:DNA repair protein RecO (recombination protein O)
MPLWAAAACAGRASPRYSNPQNLDHHMIANGVHHATNKKSRTAYITTLHRGRSAHRSTYHAPQTMPISTINHQPHGDLRRPVGVDKFFCSQLWSLSALRRRTNPSEKPVPLPVALLLHERGGDRIASMPSEKTRAIVLRVVEFSETSLVVTLFTEDFGKVGALAKGARRPKGPFEGALDLLALVRIVFLRKSSEALDLLTEARLERRFRSAERDLSRLHAGYYVAELLAELTEGGDPHPELFQAADACLLALDRGDSVAGAVLRLELAALTQLGHLPSLDQCVACGRSVAGGSRAPLDMTAGGVLCSECRPGRRGVVSVSSGVIEALRGATMGTAGQASSGTADELDLKIHGELRAVMSNYLAHLVGHRLRMSDYLGGAGG